MEEYDKREGRKKVKYFKLIEHVLRHLKCIVKPNTHFTSLAARLTEDGIDLDLDLENLDLDPIGYNSKGLRERIKI